MFAKLKSLKIGLKEILPLFEGGKGIGISNGITAGAWALNGGVGTFSAANADYYDVNGNFVPYYYSGKTRMERHKELIAQSIKGAIEQAKIARDFCKDSFINMNVLWEMGGCQEILESVLSKTSGLIDGITCGAGMPYKLANICAKYEVFYFPIVSSARAFNVLWRRSYKDFAKFLGAVVYEDPWVAGGHNGLSSAESPNNPELAYQRVVNLRKVMNEANLKDVPIVIAGGVWHLQDWDEYFENEEIGPVAFQFGTRPLLTQESPISNAWKEKLFTLKEGDVMLNDFSPTGFYSSAVYNNFLEQLHQRSTRQVQYSTQLNETFTKKFIYGPRKRELFIKEDDWNSVMQWVEAGFDQILKTPDKTVIFETVEATQEIHNDQTNCMGCLSACRFSAWNQHQTGEIMPDPRSFCIQKSLQNIAHGACVEDNLMFSGKNVFNFAKDEFYKDKFIPTIKQLINRIKTGK